MSNIVNRNSIRRRCRSVPSAPPDLPAVEDLRIRIVLGRIRSPALAAVIAAHAFAVGTAR